jgi:2-dehydro-3-deoxyphosphogluconate aldolase / (4S)-4-hydroxy-2-oxoglutarate aldolase
MTLSRAQKETFSRMLEEKIVAVVRLDDANKGVDVARALVSGGVNFIEVALTTPDAVELISQIRKSVPEAIVGAGTVMTTQDLLSLGPAEPAFAVAPILDPRVVRYAQEKGILFSPGTYSPTETYQAWEMGCPIVKVFPATRLGPKYVSDLKAPMPFLRLMPTGGIDDKTIREFLQCGADVVGAGGWLVDSAAIARGELSVLTEKALCLVAARD